jgi:pyridoxal phosphate enzyme (YggS family)
VAVSKMHPVEEIKVVYDAGQRNFGENKVMELMDKKDLLPTDIQWHVIGHLQTNKVKYIAPFVYLIHSLDSAKLAAEIDKQAKKCNRVIDCLLEIFIASEETKFGLSFEEAEDFLNNNASKFTNIRITGVMGMATNTENKEQVRREFKSMADFYKKYEKAFNFKHLSMGMTNDYKIAIEEGSNMVRIGSAIFNSL